jgi:hypothetical protein
MPFAAIRGIEMLRRSTIATAKLVRDQIRER